LAQPFELSPHLGDAIGLLFVKLRARNLGADHLLCRHAILHKLFVRHRPE
jgi:hypothetical protein